MVNVAGYVIYRAIRSAITAWAGEPIKFTICPYCGKKGYYIYKYQGMTFSRCKKCKHYQHWEGRSIHLIPSHVPVYIVPPPSSVSVQYKKAWSKAKATTTLSVLSTMGVALTVTDMPRDFYRILHLVLCLTSAVAFVKAKRVGLEFWQWAFGVSAAIYNPFLPVHLGDKTLWTVFNALTVILFWVGGYYTGLAFSRLESSLECLQSSDTRP